MKTTKQRCPECGGSLRFVPGDAESYEGFECAEECGYFVSTDYREGMTTAGEDGPSDADPGL